MIDESTNESDVILYIVEPNNSFDIHEAKNLQKWKEKWINPQFLLETLTLLFQELEKVEKK